MEPSGQHKCAKTNEMQKGAQLVKGNSKRKVKRNGERFKRMQIDISHITRTYLS